MWRFDAYSAKSNTIEPIVRSLYCDTNNLIYNQARFKQPSKHGGVCLLACKFIERRLACLNKQATKRNKQVSKHACLFLSIVNAMTIKNRYLILLI